MSLLQGGRCAICLRRRRLAVDHDHRHCPGQEGCPTCVRGLLCFPCNGALGELGGDDNIPRLLVYLGESGVSVAADTRMAFDPAELFAEAFHLDPLPWQREYLNAEGDVVVSKGRQVGASSAAAALAIHVARYRAASNVVIVSPSLKQSTEVLGKARAGARTLGLRLVQDSRSMLQLTNTSRIISLPGTPRSVRGWSARLLIIDEAAFVGADTFTAARALVATGGRTILQSTPGNEDGRLLRGRQGRRRARPVHHPVRVGVDHRADVPRVRTAIDDPRGVRPRVRMQVRHRVDRASPVQP